MRIFILCVFVIITFKSFSQVPGRTIFSAIVLDTDSVPIPNVTIFDIRSGKTVRSNDKGFFEIEIAADDSIFIYHIAYKRKFINKNDNGKLIVLEPEIHELNQVDVTNMKEQERKNLEETMKEIKRLAPLNKNTEYDMKARQNTFINQNGSHNRGFSPFFGPTTHTSVQKVAGIIGGTKEKRERKKLTSHYHLVKKKKKQSND